MTTLTLSSDELVRRAKARIESLTAEDAVALLDDPGTRFVDLRDVRELQREGTVPGALHCPRGMLEFWVDPDSPITRTRSPPASVSSCSAPWVTVPPWPPSSWWRWALARCVTSKEVSKPGAKPAARWIRRTESGAHFSGPHTRSNPATTNGIMRS